MPHLTAYISGHGFGHVAQTGPVLNALREMRPDVALTVVSSAPPAVLRQRIDGDFTLEPRAADFGFVMEDPFRIDRAASARAYQQFHADWPARIAAEAAWLQARRTDLVLANAAYLPLAAARSVGIPAWGLSSLNWAGLFAFVYGGEAWAAPIHRQMLEAYAGAKAFFKLQPAMPMDDLPNSRWSGPVARLGQSRPAALRQALGLPASCRVVLVALGGIASRLPIADWPVTPDLFWLVPAAWQPARPDMGAFESLQWDFTELLASVDAVVGKPGYGTFAEAACNGIPMLYARRPAWPEQDVLIDWLRQTARCVEVPEARLEKGALASDLAALWHQEAPPRPEPTGAREVAAALAAGLPM
ncbi:hypothetical protein AZSI13_16990 [Azospira sp. I13]|uniref:hypothetical protein n=1 Tax=Azospira sp. I13 TaxID=1765050 RepID=UPI000D4A6747|nr:hypothetical protein [Azospira sp. I13]GBG02372.1 hypothetical protein AZSI13_16990 [Azospira sp. I13]